MQEPSYGPFQLLLGGNGTGFPEGMGNQFMRQTGLDPRDPNNGAAMIDFALDQAAQKGWGQWYGAAKAGIGSRDGIGGNARSIGEYTPGGDGSIMGGTVELPSDVPAPLFYDEAPATLAKASMNPFDLIVPSAAASEMPQRDVISVPDIRTVQGDAPAAPAGLLNSDITTLAQQVGYNAADAQMTPGQRRRKTIYDSAPLPVIPTSDTSNPGAGIGRMGSVMKQGDPSNVLTPEQKALAYRLGSNIGSAGGPTGFKTTMDFTDDPKLSAAAGMTFADQAPMPRLAAEDFSMDPNGPVIPGMTHTAQPFPQDANNPLTGNSGGGGAGLPNGANAPKPEGNPNYFPPAPKAPGKFNIGNFLGALGMVMGALDQGSPELKGVSLDGYAHKPENTQLAMPKGLLG
jgi:hypothetical protein